MADLSDSVQPAGLQPWPGGGWQHPAADGQVPPEALLQGASVAWAHLRPAERKAIRATCRNGRHLHDSLTTGLRIVVGRDATQQEQQHQEHHQPTPPELQASLRAVVRRGSRLQSLTMRFDNPDEDRRQAQL